jgi:endonuclease/exonuclease/phosphatase family metal-dependent hydrolase
MSRISVMTFNMWKIDGHPAKWPHRRMSILECLKILKPDILCIQELHPLLHDTIVEALPTHAFVKDDFEGWQSEGNIYWNSAIFNMLQYGNIDIGIVEPLRRLFWVLLTLNKSDEERKKSNQSAGNQLLVATAHFTWEGQAKERETDVNLRKQQAHRTVTALQHLMSKSGNPQLPVLFMGDLNETYHPRRILYEAGFIDCFAELRLPPPTTHPQRPSAPHEDILADVTLDWIMQNKYARPVLANVIRNMLCTNGYVVSDHCPVMCV